MKKRCSLIAFVVLIAAPLDSASAQEHSGMPAMQRVDEAPVQADAIPLSPEQDPGKLKEVWYRVGDGYIVRNVSQPTLTPALPDPAKATGAAVIVAPGGGGMILTIDHEGWRIARRLAEQGIAAFVLKYRVSETPDDEAEFGAFSQQRMMEVARRARSGEPMGFEDFRAMAAEDAFAAIRLVRANSSKWHIDPKRVGLMGFSAGAAIAVDIGVAPGATDRPDFIAPFYPPMDAEVVPADAPPMFLALAFDDQLFGGQKLGIVEAWREAHRPVEFHGYQNGGHGFGLGKLGTTTELVFDQFMLWMRTRGLLEPGAESAH